MEIKIGVSDNPRELVVSSQDSHDEVEARITEALSSSDGLLTLTDDQGRRFVLPAAKICYVEIGVPDSRRVGFSVGQ